MVDIQTTYEIYEKNKKGILIILTILFIAVKYRFFAKRKGIDKECKITKVTKVSEIFSDMGSGSVFKNLINSLNNEASKDFRWRSVVGMILMMDRIYDLYKIDGFLYNSYFFDFNIGNQLIEMYDYNHKPVFDPNDNQDLINKLGQIKSKYN